MRGEGTRQRVHGQVCGARSRRQVLTHSRLTHSRQVKSLCNIRGPLGKYLATIRVILYYKFLYICLGRAQSKAADQVARSRKQGEHDDEAPGARAKRAQGKGPRSAERDLLTCAYLCLTPSESADGGEAN